ncbi:MAG: hypothetical protein ACFBSG_14605 [Leptolyngbyaceae cyanobacterium]
MEQLDGRILSLIVGVLLSASLFGVVASEFSGSPAEIALSSDTWAVAVPLAVMLFLSVYIILSQRFSKNAEYWAFGIIGSIIGYGLAVP